MAYRISPTKDVEELARRADGAIDEIEQMTKRGYISDGAVKNSSRSYIYEEDGVLKYYNAKTEVTSIVNLG